MAAHRRFAYRLSVQTVLPPDFATNESFRRTAEGLRDLGLWGMELNIADLDDERTRDVLRVREFLARYDLELSMFASGLTAKTLGVSLSATEETARAAAVAAARRMVDWVAGGARRHQAERDRPTGIIIGFLKGAVSSDPAAARRSLVASLEELAPYAADHGVPLVLEATNRYETSVVNSLGDGVALVDEVADAVAESVRETLRILPDTFHMNIEESDMARAMTESSAYFDSFHLSDNNRLFPGFGAIDFERVVATLEVLGYEGRLAIEGNLREDLLTDLRRSVEYLSPILGEGSGGDHG